MAATLNTYVDEIESALRDVMATYRSPHSLYDPVHYLFDGGGKRIRPLMTLLACEACGGVRAHAMPAALAVELMHNFTLVHDDIMDSSAMRRGRPTVHMKWDLNTAILSGDVMMGVAMRLLEQSARHAAAPVDVFSAFSTGLIDVCDGQALDLELQTSPSASIDAYFDMITKKTARLLETSVVLGAHIAGAASPLTETLRTFARNIGVAFQLQDDVLDLLGTDGFGKTPGGDVIEGKRTWLILTARERVAAARSGDRVHDRASIDAYHELLAAFDAQSGLPKERVPEVRAMMDALGVIDDARAVVRDLTEDAFAHLHALPASEARDMLHHLATQLMGRTT